MKYCSECGPKLSEPANGGRPRMACPQCGAVYLLDPRLAAACIAQWGDQVLLCRRATGPGHGLWSLPGGFIESNEDPVTGATRELLEEAGASVKIERPYALFRVAASHQLHIVYLATLLEIDFKPGSESLDAALFGESSAPCNQLAFASTREALRRYFTDRRRGAFGFLYADIVPFAPALHGDSGYP